MSLLQTALGLVEIRELHSLAEMVAAEVLQFKVWGKDDIPTPKEILIPVQHEGGLLAGAFGPAGELVGLVFSFPTRDPAVSHSHLLATLEEWRGQKIGTALKWFQRSWCLERGIRRVRWTVDPLRAANAELNIRHLGGTCSTYFVDYYGAMEGIDAGLPTDRLLVEWDLASQRVADRALALPADNGFPAALAANRVDQGQPAALAVDWCQPALLLRIPEGFIKLSQTDPQQANAWRLHTRAIFQEAFARGYQINEFTRAGGPAYLLEKKIES
jgi:chorismate synthase